MSLRRRSHSDTTLAPELSPIVRLWLLRLLVPLNAQQHFVTRHGLHDDALSSALGLGKWADLDDEAFDVRAVRADLRKLHTRAEAQAQKAQVHPQLSKNVARLAALIGLTEVDQRILEFAVMLQNERVLDDTADHLGQLSSVKIHHVVSGVLGLRHASVRAALAGDSMLTRSGLLSMERHGTGSLRGKLNLLSDRFADHISSSEVDPIGFLRDTVLPSPQGHLTLQDFEHLKESMEVLVPYLRRSAQARRVGVNILMHGSPGTGKSQLAKVLAANLGYALYEVSGEDADGDPLTGGARLRAYRAAQSVLSQSHALILFDEVEDVFDSSEKETVFGPPPASKGKKAWINRVLESNAVPAFWLTNSISAIDGAFLRRFDMIVECPVPPKKQRAKIAKEACAGLLDAQGISRLADCERLAPAVVARAAAVVRAVESDLTTAQPGEALQRLINQTLHAQGHAGLKIADSNDLPETYDAAFIRADTDLAVVVQGVAKAGSARICLYGPPGTGKTAWVRWLALQLGRRLLVRRASDLMSMWVGQTEKLIAEAFRRADADGAVLLIDEVDSFLQERRGARHSWEVTQVNEMLTQMEAFSGIFVASTNLMDGLDEASLRRFDLKVRFDYLLPDQACALFVRQAKVLKLRKPTDDLMQRIRRMDQLAPGDFAAVARQHRFRPLRDTLDLAAALEGEVSLRRRGSTRTIGFV